MKDPSIPKSQKKPALESILQKLNCHEITQRFFGTQMIIQGFSRLLVMPSPMASVHLLGTASICRHTGLIALGTILQAGRQRQTMAVSLQVSWRTTTG